ncbi:MAG: exodeoxyribonuclease V subunit beta [Chlorobiaceae bacterium]
MKPLNHATVPLSGVNLIEASAGTGKTYAIAALYLRLLLEQKLMPEQILVVTYTDAATRELRLRIRRRVREALDVLEGGATNDEFLAGLKERTLSSGKPEDAVEHLFAALAAFDSAAIMTIHGFSLRALQESAFESGSTFDRELISDQKRLLQEVSDDFWRLHFFGDHSPMLDYVIGHKLSALKFTAFLREMQNGGIDGVIPAFSEGDVAALEASCLLTFQELSELWHREREEIKRLLRENKGLSRSEKNYREDKLKILFDAMERFTAAGNPLALFTGFEKLTKSAIDLGVTTKGAPPEHRLFVLAEKLQTCVEQRVLALKAELLAFYRKNIPERKREENVRFFDDLLTDLHDALTVPERAGVLAETIRNRYRAALVDEFQDTDPVQYEIFRTIFSGSDAPLFMIGDPKQAIYSFRGADIFAYLRAASDVSEDRRFTLTANWRSTPALLRAFNLLFEEKRRPFVFEGIPYHPLTAGSTHQSPSGKEGPAQPLQICLIDPSTPDGNMNAAVSERLASELSARMIAALLSDSLEPETFIEGRRIEADDIAVIVRTHRQARAVRAALRGRGVASVMRTDESVFTSPEALELRTLISALADPGSEGLVRTALVTSMMGRTGSDIERLNREESAWVECLQQFRRYHRIWIESGFMQMARALMRDESIRRRLLSAPGKEGDRRLTNLLHCFEILHRQAHDRGLGPESLVSWFSEQIEAKEPGEEYQIRLESDEPAVRIVTVHVSKGLQYPVVFAPFMFGSSSKDLDVVQFHDENGRLVKDFGSLNIARHRVEAERETFAENLRLFYVALTRAESRCVLFTGRVIDGRKKNDPPALPPAAYLLNTSDEAKQSRDMVGLARREFGAMRFSQIENTLRELAMSSEGCIGFRKFTAEECLLSTPPAPSRATESDAKRREVRRFDAEIDQGWRVASFTSFSRLQKRAPELPDRDEPAFAPLRIEPPAKEDRTIFAFDRGARAGILMHSIFESLDFSSAGELEVKEIVEKLLERHGFDESWQPALSSMVHEVLSTPLMLTGTPCTLSGIKPSCKLVELEFFFPLKRLTAPALAALLIKYGLITETTDLATLAASLDFHPVKGFLMGFMDMVFEHQGRFWLLDWKSNHLGNRPEDYNALAIRSSMEEHRYALQYLLYAVALDRYLSIRVPGYSYTTHFGGVLYIYLRGVRAASGEETGIFRDLPPEPLIRELAALLIETGEDAR